MGGEYEPNFNVIINNSKVSGHHAIIPTVNIKTADIDNLPSGEHNILKLIGVEDSPTFKRTKVVNMSEETQMILQAAQYLDSETILKHLPFLSPDEIEEVMERKQAEEAERFEQAMALQGMEMETENGNGNSGNDTESGIIKE